MVHPERRFFPLQQQTTSETAIRTNLLSDLYVALGESDDAGNWTLRAYWKPLVPWIWIGCGHHGLGWHGQPERPALAGRRCRACAPQRPPVATGRGRVTPMRRVLFLAPLLVFMVLAWYFASALRPTAIRRSCHRR